MEVMRQGRATTCSRTTRPGWRWRWNTQWPPAGIARPVAVRPRTGRSRQQLSELAQHLQTSIEMERAAIAREIHDDVGGALTALRSTWPGWPGTCPNLMCSSG